MSKWSAAVLVLTAVAVVAPAVALAGQLPGTSSQQVSRTTEQVPHMSPEQAPRISPDFLVAESGQPTVALSSFKGKVVVMEFLFASSAHCMRVAQTLNKLYGELGSQGFQPLAVVFDPPNARQSGQQLIPLMHEYFKLTYPVGYASKADVDSYLDRAPDQILNIPQLVIIDRAGRIRASSGGAGGDPALEDEGSLRTLIRKLLGEAAPGLQR
jgi:AhpC/TSA family